MFLFWRVNQISLHPSLRKLFFCQPFNSPSVHPFGQLFSCRPFNFPSVHSFGELFSCRPFNSPSFGEFFCADHITLHPSIVLESYFLPSIPWASYFRADHSIGLSVYPFGELFLCRRSLGESYFRADHLILHLLASYFNVYHITLHPSILLVSYFCAVHCLGELFSCLPFHSPLFGELFFVPII